MKNILEDLAIFGGQPAFDKPLYVGKPNIGNKNKLFERINEMLDRRWLTNDGPLVQEFEEKLADIIGVKHCITVCNATIGLEIVIRACGMHGEVIIPSFTFIATAHALQWQEITPVFCDIDPETHNIDPKRLDGLITPRTTGIIGVHTWGRPCDITELCNIARKNDLHLVFDSAHAFGCSYDQKMIGTFGDAEVFSFHATKFFNTFEGGAITTNDDDLARKIRLMKNFGFSGIDTVTYIGTNGKMSEVSAAMGLTGLESLDEFIAINYHNYKHYQNKLNNLPQVKLIQYDETEKQNYQYIILEVDENSTGINRDKLVKILRAENVYARRYFFPGCHDMEPYRSYFPNARLLLPETDRLVQNVFSLPNGTSVDEEDIDHICELILFCFQNSAEIVQRLSQPEN